MVIDIFEGSRRLARVTTVLLMLVTGVSTFTGQSDFYQYIRVDKPSDTPAVIADCPVTDYSRWIGIAPASWGLSYSRFLCVNQWKSEAGETIGIITKQQGDSFLIHLPSSNEGSNYLDKLSQSDLLMHVPPPPIADIFRHFLARLVLALLAAVATGLIMTGIFKLIGWVARGFLAK